MKHLSKFLLFRIWQNLSVRISTLLFFHRKGDFEIFRNSIIKSWPFSNLSLWPRAFEKCFRGSSYVASYVNCGSRFPTFLKTYFKPKHSYSKGFGVGSSLFSLSTILDHFDRGFLSFGMQTVKNGSPQLLMFLFPHTLYIDTSLNLKGILGFILLRYAGYARNIKL